MGSSDGSSSSSSSSSSDSSDDKKRKKKKKKSKKEKKGKKKDKKVKKKASKDPISRWVLHHSKEEMAKKTEKRRKREQKQAERERMDAQAEAERAQLQRQLFGVMMQGVGSSSSQSARQAFCPMRPEVGLMKMEEDEMAARMLCGTCKGGKQHSGANA